MGDGKYRPPNFQIIFTGFYKHESNKITPGWDSSACERAKPEPASWTPNPAFGRPDPASWRPEAASGRLEVASGSPDSASGRP